jgi:hypothetical protein
MEGRKNKMGQARGWPAPAVRPLVGDCWLPTRGPAAWAGRESVPLLLACSQKKLFYFYFLFGVMRYFLAFGENGCTIHHFFKLPPTLGSVKSSIPHKV